MSEQKFTKEEKDVLIKLISDKQLRHLIVEDKYDTDEYFFLERLKAKIRNI